MKRPSVIIGIIAVLVLSAGIAVLSLWPDAAKQPLPVQTPAPAGLSIDLFSEPYLNITDIQFTPDEGDVYSLIFDQELDTIILDAENVVFSSEEDLLFSVFFQAAGLSNLTGITKEADDSQLELFGFDQPVMNIRFNLMDGSFVEVEIGAVPAAGQGRYARLKNSREVALLNDTRSMMLTLELEMFYSISFFPVHLHSDMDSAVFSINHILVENGDGITEIRRRTDEELMEFSLGTSIYQLMKPTAAEGNDGVIQSFLLENIIMLMPDKIVSVLPEDLLAFKNNNPVRLTVTAVDWSGTLLIGNRDAESGGQLVMIEGHDAVLLDRNGDYSFLDLTFTQLRSTLIWIHHITDVSSVTFKLEDITRVLRIEHNSGDGSIRGWLDDVELSEVNARRLFVASMLINPNGETDSPIPPGVSPDYTVTMSMTNGTSEKVELYRQSDSQFLIVHNGENKGFFITRLALQQNVLNKFDIVDSGGEIPLV